MKPQHIPTSIYVPMPRLMFVSHVIQFPFDTFRLYFYLAGGVSPLGFYIIRLFDCVPCDLFPQKYYIPTWVRTIKMFAYCFFFFRKLKNNEIYRADDDDGLYLLLTALYTKKLSY